MESVVTVAKDDSKFQSTPKGSQGVTSFGKGIVRFGLVDQPHRALSITEISHEPGAGKRNGTPHPSDTESFAGMCSSITAPSCTASG